MEDAGEIVTVMGHTREGDSIKCDEQLVFVIDEIKGSKKRTKVSKARLILHASWYSSFVLVQFFSLSACSLPQF